MEEGVGKEGELRWRREWGQGRVEMGEGRNGSESVGASKRTVWSAEETSASRRNIN